MPLEAPNLDDRRFDQIVQELQSLIPRYTPEWTDLNASDPGITLIQLFAWLGEMILFRLNRVPDRNYLKFLELLGIQPQPAMPATALLTFTLVSPDAGPVLIPSRTRVGAAAPPPASGATASPTLPAAEEEPVVFETEEPLMALGATLQKVQLFDGLQYRDYTEENQPTGKYYPPFGPHPREKNALMLGLAYNNPFPQVEFNLTLRVPGSDPQATGASCDLPEDKIRPSAILSWEYWDGSGWRVLDLRQDDTRAFTRSGQVYFRGPKDAKPAKLGFFTTADDPELYWLRCRLVQSQYEMAPQLDAVLLNTVRARAVATVLDEVLGSSNGQANQRFRLSHFPVYADPPVAAPEGWGQAASPEAQDALDQVVRDQELLKGFLLEIDEGQGLKPWLEVEDFFSSQPRDSHYVLNRATGDILFDKRARTPLAGANNIVARYYRYGGGARGNVGAQTITDLQTPAAFVDHVQNYYPAEGGTDEEPIADAKLRAPKEIKSRSRAVTAEDFEFLARQTPGGRVRRAHALPLYHPQFPGVQVPGAITVIIIPDSQEPKPMPSEGTLQTVCAYLNQHRLLTTEVFVAAPQYNQVKITATVQAKPTADPGTVKTQVEAALTAYLDPLQGGDDLQGWPLGGPVLYSEIFRTVLQVQGVQYIQNLRIVVDGKSYKPCDDAIIASDHLVFSDGHEITVTFSPLAA